MPALASELRSLLEKTIIKARATAEDAARAALVALGVEREDALPGISDEQRRMRVALRARARQLGDGSMRRGIEPLVEEVAYEQWHRMLFARFLAENHLLMHPSGVPVSLAECVELAAEEGESDPWLLAARYASGMLPGIFRLDDPSVQVRFAPEGRIALERLVEELPAAVFTADDALGWVYQFWQTKKYEEVNASGRKIGAADVSPYTQRFTEDYMVRFLLENSLGAWWSARHPDSPLLKDYTYLRFREDGTPAAGTFPGWPERAAEATVMDPCCGSGHFLVAGFEMLRRMRMEEEGLGEAEAGDAVIRDNLFGLEIDPRCTQIAAFALALAAWKAGGYRPLPLPNIACSGIPVVGQLDEWLKLAGEDVKLSETLKRLYYLFSEAPTLGSLINPADVPLQGRLFESDYSQVAPLLQRVLKQEQAAGDPVAAVFGNAAEGVARAATLLAGKYTLVATNVPYLSRGKQDEVLRQFCKEHYPKSKWDLATVFVERCRAFANHGSTCALVTPQNWLLLGSYDNLRIQLLRNVQWNLIARLGPAAFQGMNWWAANTALLMVTEIHPERDHRILGLDVSEPRDPGQKDLLLRVTRLESVCQEDQLKNPDARIVTGEPIGEALLGRYAIGLQGIATADYPRFGRCFWELSLPRDGWDFQQSTIEETKAYGGREHIIYWEEGHGALAASSQARIQGLAALGKLGVAVAQMGQLSCTLYTGQLFDNNTAVIVPKNKELLPAIWAFCQSPEFLSAVRQIDTAVKVTNATLVKVPFDLEQWQEVAEETGPLPEPYSNDPTQWLFKGDPTDATRSLQVAVARLLGYSWPQQEDQRLDAVAIPSGIACLPAVAGEPPAAERLWRLLAEAYGAEWSVAKQDELLAAEGYGGRTLEEWLRDAFFVRHCETFHNRPFIWHIWDGRRDGFSALVNYHKLDHVTLNRLIYTHLTGWIDVQTAERKAGVSGADGRLVAALELKKKLEAIRDGEPPYDIYVRWKPLEKQPLGWEPDLNDGVRLNIRPFVTAGVLRSRFTINWNKDRGKNPDGTERLNDLHYTRAEKEVAREAAKAKMQTTA